MIPIRIFNGSLGGATLYQNMSYITPNEERSNLKKFKGYSYFILSFSDLYNIVRL
jgi:ribosome biogenesis protein BRX1